MTCGCNLLLGAKLEFDTHALKFHSIILCRVSDLSIVATAYWGSKHVSESDREQQRSLQSQVSGRFTLHHSIRPVPGRPASTSTAAGDPCCIEDSYSNEGFVVQHASRTDQVGSRQAI